MVGQKNASSKLVPLDQVRTLVKTRLAKRSGTAHAATLQKLLAMLQPKFATG